MRFEKKDVPDAFNFHEYWTSGAYAVVVLRYAFGQRRVQVWYQYPGATYPDVLFTQF